MSFVVSTRGCYHLAAIVIVSITRTLSEIDIDRTCRVAETDRTRTMPIEKSRMDLSLQKIILFSSSSSSSSSFCPMERSI